VQIAVELKKSWFSFHHINHSSSVDEWTGEGVSYDWNDFMMDYDP